MKKLLAAMFVALLMAGCGDDEESGSDSSESNQSAADDHFPAKTAEAAKALLNAVKKGNIEAAKQAITDGADVNGKDRLFSCQLKGTPLHQAVNLDRQEIIELLISKGADVNAKDMLFEFTSLDWAVKLKRTEITNLLRKHGGKSSAEDSIHIAARLGNIEAVKKHLDAGVDVNSKAGLLQTPLDFTKELGADDYILFDLNLPEDTLEIKAAKKEIADLLHKHGGKHSSIQEAAIGGDLEGVGAFLTAGVDPNETTGFTFGKTPLHDASTKEIAELLIAKGADVNAVVTNVGTPLHFAAMKGRKEIAELLITKGADVNFHKQGAAVTPLDRAKMKKHIETAELLRKHGGKTRRELKAEGKIIAEAIDWDLQERGKKGEELWYAPNQQKPYTGWAKEMYDNGQIRGLAQYKDGKADDLATMWYKNGQKSLETTNKDGKLMTVVAWKPNGEKCPHTNFVDRTGVVVWYNEDGTEKYRRTYKDGVKVD